MRETALAIIDNGNDTAAMRALGMKPADMRKRMVQLAALRARLLAEPPALRERKTIKEPEPYVFELHGVYAYPTRGGSAINPYMPAKRFDRAAWSPDGFGPMLIVGRGRAFGYLAWYSAVGVAELCTLFLKAMRWLSASDGLPRHFMERATERISGSWSGAR